MRECDELLKCVQRSRDSQLDFAGGSRLQAARLKHTCQACQKLKCCASCSLQDKVPGWPGRLLAAWTRDSTQSEVKPLEHPVWQNMTFHIPSHPTIYIYIYPYTHDSKRDSRENFERETLEKIRLTHPQSFPKRLFKFLHSLPLHCQIFERLITKTFSHHIHLCERAVWCFGKQLGRNQFHIGWYYGQVAESGKLEKK